MDLLLKDKKALILASSKGIGRGVAIALAREGCSVIITSHIKENLENARKNIEEIPNAKVDSYVMDITSHASLNKVCNDIIADHQSIDILITNSPGPKVLDAAAADVVTLREAFEVNFFSVVELCNKFLPGMKKNGFGRIINLTSTTGKEPDEGMVLSNTTRASVLAYAKTLSREVARYGVTVNSILTGGVMTERTVHLLEIAARKMNISYDAMLKRAAEEVPVGFISTPEQFCHAIAFLASPRSMYINGVSLAVDGGCMREI